jgi:uncharacterized protein
MGQSRVKGVLGRMNLRKPMTKVADYPASYHIFPHILHTEPANSSFLTPFSLKKTPLIPFFAPVMLLVRIPFLLCLLAFRAGYAQTADGITVLAKPKREGIWIRYAPNTPYVWQLGNRYGYIVERFQLRPDGTLLQTTGKKLFSDPIRPLSQAEFDKLEQTEPRAAIVSEMIYNPEFRQNAPLTGPAAILGKNREQENRFGLALFACDLSRPVAIAAGLMVIDKSAVPKSRYIYRVSLAQVPAGVKINPGVAVVDVLPEQPLFPPSDLQAAFADQKVKLSWLIKLHRGIYSAYQIERSMDGKNFKAVNDLPYAYMTDIPNPETAYFADSLTDNEQTFYYRIKGITPFGETGPASAVVSGKGKIDVTGLIVIEKAEAVQNKSVNLQWRFPDVFRSEIKGYIVARANTAGGPYTDLVAAPLPPNRLTFTDNTPLLNNYYIVRVIDREGKERTRSFPFLGQLEDATPPAVPLGLSGKTDSTGVVRLTWKANADKDLKGYRVFRANSPEEEFVEVTRQILTQTTFTDTINLQTLTRRIYYKVIAVDDYFNTSAYSGALALQRPDRVAPSPPVFIKVLMEKENVLLEWNPSISEDVLRYTLFRTTPDSLPLKISTWSAGESKTTFSDKPPALGKTYRYILQASDSAGNTAQAVSGDVVFETGIRGAVSGVKVTPDREKKKIVLEWNYPAAETPVRCVIYRAKGTEPVTLYETLPGNPGKFEDRDLTVSNIYTYQIKIYFKRGIQTPLTDPLRVEY